MTFAQAARRAIQLGGRYSGGELAENLNAMTVASRKYAPLQDLHDAVGKRIAELTKSEAALVSAGAASALAIGTAGVLAGTDRDKVRRLPDTRGMKRARSTTSQR